MNAIIPLIIAMCVFVLAYRYYSAFIATKVLMLSNKNITPAVEKEDGRDYVPTNKWIVFGQHFAAIAGAGPLIGPVLAAQYGWGPAFFWILLGSVFAGAVHDMVLLFASIRHKGESLALIARSKVSHLTGVITSIITFFILIITLAGVGLAVVNILRNNPWGVFSIAMTIPIGMLVGFYIFRVRNSSILLGSAVGVVLVCLGVFVGPYVVKTQVGSWFTLSRDATALVLPTYAFFAAVLPVWLLLTPRGYLSTYMKIGVVVVLVVGLFFVMPNIRMPFTTEFMSGGGPIIDGPWWPYVFITIACGAISGFHALVGTGTTPKLVTRESHIPMISYGAMLAEAFVSLMALLAVVTLVPADYFAINATSEAFAKLNMSVVDLPRLSSLVQFDVMHRPGGAISLAIGIAHIFSHVSGWFARTMHYWFQFILMFEALFILTLIDSGARIARYILQNIIGAAYKPLRKNNSMLYVVITSAMVSVIWGYLLYTGDISSVWPLFGATNQALAALALAVGTTIIIETCKKKIYILVTLVPCIFVFITAMGACVYNIKSYLAKDQILNVWLCVAIMVMISVVIVDNVRKWWVLLREKSNNKTTA